MPIGKKGLCSICCLGYKHAAFLEQNIRAIWEGSYKNVEIIAVDDGSGDGSVELLQDLARNSPCPMHVIEQENTGCVGKNFNNALRLAQGEYIIFMSLDDVLFPDAIATKINLMEQDCRICFVADSKVMGISEVGEVSDSIPQLKLHTLSHPTIKELLDLEFEEFGSFYIQSCVFRKKIIDAVGGFDEDMVGDDIVLRTKVFRYLMENQELDFRILQEPSCYYRMHSNNIHKNTLRQVKIVTEYLSRYWSDKPNPPLLISWVKSVIRRYKFEEYIPLFTWNSSAAALLLESRIQEKIKISVIANRAKWFHHIFKKIKLAGGKRKLVLISLVSIEYQKKTGWFTSKIRIGLVKPTNGGI